MNQEKTVFSLRRLLDPPFVLALMVLLLNDHVWKAAFHNGFTGKISDFTGLYAFVWVVMCLLVRTRVLMPWLVAIAFAWWKSPFSQPALDAWNSLGWISLDRVIDWSDLLALAVLPLAAARFQRMPVMQWQRTIPAMGHWILLFVSLITFVATSQKEEYTYDNAYSFVLSPQQLVDRLNKMNHEQQLGNPGLSLHHENANDFRQEGDIRLYLHHNKEVETRFDTIYARLEDSDSIFIEEVRPYDVPLVDSMYVNPDGIFEWYFDARPAGVPDSLASCITLPAILKLRPENNDSKLDLMLITLGNCGQQMKMSEGRTAQVALRETFEKTVVNPLKAPASNGAGAVQH